MEGRRSANERPAFGKGASPENPETSAGIARNDRRADGRMVPLAPIAARVRGLHFARILNISRTGVLAESTALVRPRERNELLIHLPRGPFVTQALVQRCRAWRQSTNLHGLRILFFRSGLEFDSLSRQDLDFLEQNLRVLGPSPAILGP